MSGKKVEYRLLGNSGIRVHPFCLGAMTFGNEETFKEVFGCTTPFEVAEQLILKYIKAGGNFIDTANFYQLGESEEILGKVIKKNKINRDDLVIATKYSLPMSFSNPNQVGNSKKNLVRSIKESLKRLDTDYIDILYVHFWDWSVEISTLMHSLDVLVKSGKVLHIGLSDTPAWISAAAQMYAQQNGLAQFVCYQGRYSLVDRAMEQSILPMAQHFKMAGIPWGILGQGKLTGKRTRENKEGTDTIRKGIQMTESDFKIQDVVMKIAKKRGVSPSQIAVNWTMNQPGITSVLIGASKLHHLEDNLKALEFELTEEEFKELKEVSYNSPSPIFPYDICGSSLSTCLPVNIVGKNTYTVKSD